jgi:hypothetical protein
VVPPAAYQCLSDSLAKLVLIADRALLADAIKCNFQVCPCAGVEITFKHRRNTSIQLKETPKSWQPSDAPARRSWCGAKSCGEEARQTLFVPATGEPCGVV